MATQAQEFIFDDPLGSGKKYRVRSDDPNASREQAAEYLNTIPVEELNQYEFNTETTVATPSTVAPKQAAPAVPQAVPQETAGLPPKLTGWELDPLREREISDQTRIDVPEANTELRQAWIMGDRRPETYNAILAKYGNPTKLTAADIAAGQKREAYYKARNIDIEGNVFSAVQQETGLAAPEAPDGMIEQAAQGATRAMMNTGNTGIALAAQGAELVGANETADDLLETYIQKNAEIEYQYGTSKSLDTIEDFSSFGMYLADTLGEFAPDLVGSMGIGALGSNAAKTILKRSATEMVEAKVEQGIAREVAEREVADAIRKRGEKAAIASTGAYTIGQESGQNFANTYMQTGEKAPVSSLVAGIAAGSLDALLPLKTLNRIGGGAVEDEFKKGIMRRMVEEGTKDFFLEGGTEAVQEFIATLPKTIVTGESPLTAETLNNMVEAFVKGGVGGATVGTTTGAMTGSKADTTRAAIETGVIKAPTSTDKRSKDYRTQLGETATQVQTVADNITKKWTNAPSKVEALSDFKSEAGVDNDAIGVYTDDGRVLINTEKVLELANQRGVSPEVITRSVVFHEALGHHGLTQLFGQDLDKVLRNLYTSSSGEFQQKVQDWIKRNTKYDETGNVVDGAYINRDANGTIDEEWRTIRAMEEVLAEWSEKDGQLPRGVVDQLFDVFKRFGRAVGVTFDINKLKDIKYTTREIKGLLAISQQRVRTGDATNAVPGAFKYLTVYHGGKPFAPTERNALGEFDHSKMSSGQGQQTFGWGSYFTDLRGIAENYKKLYGGLKKKWKGAESSDAYAMRRVVLDSVQAEFANNPALNRNEIEQFTNAVYTEKQNRVDQGYADPQVKIVTNVIDQDEFYGDYSATERDVLQKIVEYIDNNFEAEYAGNVYEVELPDNATWVDWEESLLDQPDLRKKIEANGFEFMDAEDYYQLENQYAKLGAEYRRERRAAENNQLGEELQDAAFARMKEIEPAYFALAKRIDNTLNIEDTGERVYRSLSTKLGGDEAASKFLNEAGVTGNRFLADNLIKQRPRKNDGTDEFNYVVFDDKTPKIVNKYMKANGLEEDGTGSFKAKPGVNARRMAKMLGPQLYGNPRNMGEVTVKEIFQNSVDAVRSALRGGQIDKGVIDIKVSEDGRKVTFVDNGIGMSPDILGGKFLEIAGTGKEGTKNSGGFGIAKMLFLYANKKVQVTTAKDGKIATLDTGGEQLFDALEDSSMAPNINVRDMTDEDYAVFPDGHGTKIELTIPKEVEMPGGEMQEISPIEGYYGYHDAITKSPLFSNIEVRMGDETYGTSLVETGGNFKIENYKPLASVKLPWGTAKVYVLKEPMTSKPYGDNLHFLSNGLWQFSGTMKEDPSAPYGPNLPYTFYVDIIPSVRPDEPGYPFAFNRQGFNKEAQQDFGKVQKYLNALYAFKNYQASSKNFGSISYIDENTLEFGQPVELTAELPEVNQDVTGVIQDGASIGINEEGVMTVDGVVVPDLSPEDLQKAIPKTDSLKVADGTIDPARSLIHDNTIIGSRYNENEVQSLSDYMTAKFGKRYNAFLNEVGQTLLFLRNEVVDILGYSELAKEGIGISLDPEYRGVSIRLPFSASMINPLLPASDHPLEQGYGIWGTIIHELAHHKVRNHAAEFPAEMQKILFKLETHSDKIDERKHNFARTMANLYADIINEGKILYGDDYGKRGSSELWVRTRQDSFKESREGASPGDGSTGNTVSDGGYGEFADAGQPVLDGTESGVANPEGREFGQKGAGSTDNRNVNKYMRGNGPINPNDLTAEDLMYTEDALKILERAGQAYTPTVISPEAVLDNLMARDLEPTDIARLNIVNPGQLVKRIYQYDIGATLLTEKITLLEEDMRVNGSTPEKEAEYLVATFTQDEIFKNAFSLQGELGRGLNALRKAVYTRKSTAETRKALENFLKENNLEALQDPETFMKFMQAQAEARKADSKTNATPTFGDKILNIAGLPRSIMSSMDLSAPMRQGITFILKPSYWKSFFKSFSMLGPSGANNYSYLMRTISKDPNYPLMVQARLAFSDVDGAVSNREEGFQSELANKIPGVKMSNQAYAGFLNKLRADMFNKYLEYYKKAGVDVTDAKLLADLGSFVNSATGRAELGKVAGVNLNPAGAVANSVFFSARLIRSRINMLNPLYYARLHPSVRKSALWAMTQSLVAQAGIAAATYGILAAFDWDPEIELDPRSSSFMEVKVGDTRLDFGGGYNEFMTFGARTAAWLSTATANWLGFDTELADEKTRGGKFINYGGKGRYDKTYWDEVYRFFRNKLAPVPAYAMDAMVGENPVGDEFDPAGSVASRIMPMFVSSMYDTVEQEGASVGAAVAIPALFGVGVATYPDRDRDPNQEMEGPETVIRRQLAEGAYQFYRVDAEGTVTFNIAGKKLYDATYNNHFKSLVAGYALDTGFPWANLPDKAQRQIIKDAKELAEIYTEEDMVTEMGLPMRSKGPKREVEE